MFASAGVRSDRRREADGAAGWRRAAPLTALTGQQAAATASEAEATVSRQWGGRARVEGGRAQMRMEGERKQQTEILKKKKVSVPSPD